jgi:hypothetical protein
MLKCKLYRVYVYTCLLIITIDFNEYIELVYFRFNLK